MAKWVDYSGQRFGRLVAIDCAQRRVSAVIRSRWNFQCDCGTTCIKDMVAVKRGDTTSCGCYQKEVTSLKFTTHGLSSNRADYHKFRRYGLTPNDYLQKSEDQQNKCYVCNIPNIALHVDHDHKTGTVRKLLCNNCNVVLGLVNEDPNILASLISYLDEHHREGRRYR